MMIAAIAVGLSATSANALVSITHTNNTGGATLNQLDSFNVDITLGYDGAPTLTGVFASASWDPSELQLTGSTTPPFAIFFGGSGFLSKISDPASFPGDPAGSLRTIQFGANPGQSAGAGPDTLITTLTFQVIGGVDGVAAVDVAFLSGDLISGAAGVPIVGGDLSLTGTSVSYVPVPEPGTALLMGLGLGGLGFAGRRK